MGTDIAIVIDVAFRAESVPIGMIGIDGLKTGYAVWR